MGDSTGTIGPFCSRYVPRSKKKMREDAVPLSERAPVFSPDVTNFVADERVFLDSLLRRERGGSRV